MFSSASKSNEHLRNAKNSGSAIEHLKFRLMKLAVNPARKLYNTAGYEEALCEKLYTYITLSLENSRL